MNQSSPVLLERPRTLAVEFDAPLRYNVPSNTKPEEPPYLVDLTSYEGNGECCCTHFLMRCAPLLKRRISPKCAVEQKLIKLKVNRHVEDALRCEHLITARSQFVDDVLAEIAKRRTTEDKRADRHAETRY